jgi:uncharacterized radical SAM protein YgiQ
MISKDGNNFDIILVSAEYYDDHPFSPVGVIAKVLDKEGYDVGIIEKPVSKEDFMKLGVPKLFFGVTSGTVDSMVNNYTPLKKKRIDDEYSRTHKMPDRAVIVYCNRIRECFKGAKVVIGGIEASLRRFAHYDYWDNNIRRSILLDSRADILVYGNGEKQVVEIAKKFRGGNDIVGIEGTCVLSKEIPKNFSVLPSFLDIKSDKKEFMKMQKMFSNKRNLAQEYDNNYVLQFRYPRYTTEDLDSVFALDFSRKLHPESFLKMARFSVLTHRGCIGKCSFCSISLHQGDKIVSRSEKNILDEIERMTRNPDFKGVIDDMGGPSENMFMMDCKSSYNCEKDCLGCNLLDKSQSKTIELLQKSSKVRGVKNVFIKSGVRYDIAVCNPEYVKQICKYNISGNLKIAPEHVNNKVLNLMNKNHIKELEKFKEMYHEYSFGRGSR